METIWQDIRFGVRMLANQPGVTVIDVIALALGIGASTAIFSVVNTVLLRPLPYPNGNRLVMIWEQNRPRSRDRNVVSPANFLDWREQSPVFEGMAAFFGSPFYLSRPGDSWGVIRMVTAPAPFYVFGAHANLR